MATNPRTVSPLRRALGRLWLVAAVLPTAIACSGRSGPMEVAPDPTLAPQSAVLVVRSNVYGDSVGIDGRSVGGSGPRGHRVEPGRHSVTVSKPGFVSWNTVVDLLPGDERVVRAILSPGADDRPAPPRGGPAWDETVTALGEQLRTGWGQGMPPQDFGVGNDGVMVFRVQSPSDANAWHHFSVDLRELAVSPVEHLASVVSLDCVGRAACIRQEICRDDRCAEADRVVRYRWFFDDDEHGQQAAAALGELIERVRRDELPDSTGG